MSSKQGVDESKLAELADWRKSDLFTPLERDVLALADAMCDTPSNVDQGLFDRLLAALGAERLVELTTVIGWENLRARTNRVFDAQSEHYHEGAVCMLPQEQPA
ncbi:MAG TPA: hypothetical protein VFY93_08830 [Planctomycetota bacterium]|nr:hypothetical protein [Planctomycetota bacterium]